MRAASREGERPLWEGVPCLKGGAGTCAVTMPPTSPRPEAQLSEARFETGETDGDMDDKSHHKKTIVNLNILNR